MKKKSDINWRPAEDMYRLEYKRNCWSSIWLMELNDGGLVVRDILGEGIAVFWNPDPTSDAVELWHTDFKRFAVIQ